MVLARHAVGMFLTNCDHCGLRELRGPRSVETFVRTDHGLDLVYRCARCGTANLLAGPAPRPAVAA